jgi:Domain of Unknown Function (DUF1080)
MYRLLATLLAFLALASPAFADDKEKDKPKPNTLTPKEIEEGWILLFDGETTFGWKIDGAAEVKDGVLILGKGKKTVAYPTTGFGEYRDCSLAIMGSARLHWSDGLQVERPLDGDWETFTLTRSRDLYKLGLGNGNKMPAKPRPKGSEAAPFCIETDGKNDVKIRSVKLKPLETQPLFTGSNLDGWKINAADPKRMQSKWDATGEILSVKNGPGDLVTEKEFDNFVLQLECKTNGKALNSGIFFRCIPGQYQNGYEAQIQNAYKDNDRTKPADFGTGAIYRRVPARKVVSNDNEWFTMTIVADGKHIATWVNGYQTVDWTDERKANDNPRQGFRAAKGPISIQGHDPTTDILFRNIRIAELKK